MSEERLSPCRGKSSDFFEYKESQDKESIHISEELMNFLNTHYEKLKCESTNLLDWLSQKAKERDSKLQEIKNKHPKLQDCIIN